MKNKYQIEYEQSTDCFWAKEPAKFVKLYVEKYCSNFENLKVLDLGAGEGKNTVYLAGKGAKVTAIDISPIALSRFPLQPNYNIAKHNISIHCDNISNLQFENEQFDIIVAYGILHCLSSLKEVETMFKKILNWTRRDGIFICVTFTNELNPPLQQSYLDYESFIEKGYFEKVFGNHWDFLEKEYEIITETHPTHNIEHQHSLIRIIAKKK